MTSRAKTIIKQFAEQEIKHCLNVREMIDDWDIPDEAKQIVGDKNEERKSIFEEILKEVEK